MRALKRNQVRLWYCPFTGNTEELMDEYGNLTGEYRMSFDDPVELWANVSPATGQSRVEQFGGLEDYDKVIVGTGTCPFDENAVLFIDKEPGLQDDYSPKYDYIVKRVAQSLNSWSAAVSKVKVS